MNREKQITKTSLIGIATNIVLSIFKVIVGLLSNSIAVILDAVNNLSDALSSLITIVGIKLAKRKPNNEHPYGYGRIEYFSAILISGIVLVAGVTSMIESFKKVLHPENTQYSIVTILVIVVAIATKIILGKYVSNQGKKYNSTALVASGADASFDAILSASTLVSAAILYFFKLNVDGIVGCIISAFIVKAGLEMLLESTSSVMGNRPDSEITKDIKKTVASIPPVMGAYDLVLHNYGPDAAIGSIHIEVPATLSAREIHELTKEIQKTVLEKFKVFLTVGIYALDDEHALQRNQVRNTVLQYEGVLGCHAIYINDEKKEVSFDVLVDFTMEDKMKLKEELDKIMSTIFKGYAIDINFDTNYSD